MKRELTAIYALWKRELVRFFRQTGRVAAAVGQPLLLWIFLGIGVGETFQMQGHLPQNIHYLDFFFPGILLMILLFTAIFSTITIIEDRQEGLLRTVLVAPVSRFSIVVGKCSGGITIAMVQGGITLFLLLTPWVGLEVSFQRLLYLIGMMLIISAGFTALGFCMAWYFDSAQSYHGMMSFVLIPMWMLSGSLFPVSGVPRWLDVVMKVNPLTYGLDAFRAGFYEQFQVPEGLQISSLPWAIGVTLAFTALTLLAAAWITGGSNQRTTG